jgi:hypothetical protein
MNFYFTAKRFKKIREFFFGRETENGQYYLPISFTVYQYSDDLKRRGLLSFVVALLDLIAYATLYALSEPIMLIVDKVKAVVTYLVYETTSAKRIEEVTFMDWGGHLHRNEGLLRNSEAIIELSINEHGRTVLK